MKFHVVFVLLEGTITSPRNCKKSTNLTIKHHTNSDTLSKKVQFLDFQSKMKLVVSSLLLLLSSIEAFITTPLHNSVPKTNLFASAAETDAFFRAVECAEGARATVDELDKLATDLEKDIGCKYEEGEDACQKEIQDRLDVAQLLRLRIELQLRTDYLKKENVFASDVHKSHDADVRAKFREMLQANREKSTDGSDLGLW